MIWFNDRERGIRNGDGTGLGLSVSCTRCGHVARIRRVVALRLWGERTRARDVARDLICSKCGAAAACIQTVSDARPPWSDDDSYWGPSPDYPEVSPAPVSDFWREHEDLGENLVCNRYAAERRKAARRLQMLPGFEEWSEITRIRFNSPIEVFPNSIGPVIRKRDDGYVWEEMRWGLPGPSTQGSFPVTNVRNLSSPHWRSLLGPEHRCLVPFSAFSEYEDASPKGKKVLRWFAAPDREMMMFAGLWRTWRGDRGTKAEPNIGEHRLYSFLTTDANDVVRPVHAKAMPVILRTEAEQDEWLTAPAGAVEGIQARVLPAEALEILGQDEEEQFAGAYIK